MTFNPRTLAFKSGEIACYSAGAGDLTVVLLTGMGVPAASWFTAEGDEFLAGLMKAPIFLGVELSKLTRVVAYDRAGLGESSPPPAPRTSDDLLQELERVLEAETAPFVLIGHSIGGVIAYAYALRHRQNLAGLVLLDSSHPYQLQRLRQVRSAELQAANEQQQARIKAEHPERLDFDRIFTDGQSVKDTLASLPLLVISRGKAHPPDVYAIDEVTVTQAEADALNAEWNAMQADLASASTQNQLLIAEHSGHYLHFDEPEWTAARVKEFVGSVLQSSG